MESTEHKLLVALKNLHATAQAVIVHLESQPVVLDFIKSKLPASWPMFEECTSQASDVIAEVGEL